MPLAIGNRPVRFCWKSAPFWTVRLCLLAWAGFWIWFNAASMVGERDGLGHHLTLAAITLGLAVTGWIWPRAGGALMVFAGLGAAAAFPNVWAFWMLAVPATTIGVGLMLVRRAK